MDSQKPKKGVTIIGVNRTRTHSILFRLNDYEFSKLELDVSKSGLSRERYLRALIVNKEIKEQPSIDFYNLKNEFSAIGRNLNQLVKKANSNILDVENIKMCVAKLYDMLQQLEEKVGK